MADLIEEIANNEVSALAGNDFAVDYLPVGATNWPEGIKTEVIEGCISKADALRRFTRVYGAEQAERVIDIRRHY